MTQNDPIFDAEPATDATTARKPCPMCGEHIAASAKVCRFCGHWLDPSMKPPTRRPSGIDRVLMPVATPLSAMAAGYLGLFAVLPFVGIVTLIVSILALRTLKQDPGLDGRGRAWFGLVMGIIFTLFWGFAFILAVTK